VLGKMDQKRVFEAVLTKLAEQFPRAIIWLSLYDLAYAKAIDNPSFIDQRVAELKAASSPAAIVFDLLYRAGYQPSRFPMMLELFSSGAVPPETLNQVAYFPWGAAIPPNEAQQLAEAAISHTTKPGALVPFVWSYLSQVKDAVPVFRDLAIRLLIAPYGADSSAELMFEYEWAQLALMYVAQAPNQLAAAALQIAARESMQEGELHKVLRQAWEVGDKVQLFTEVFAPALTTERRSWWNVRQELSRFPFEELGVEFLMSWVAVKPEERAYALAAVIGPPSEQFCDLHAALLEHFDEYGVGGTFFAAYNSGTWIGPASGWTRSKLERARQWLEDEQPAVQDWARDLVQYLEEELKRNEARDAEERLLR
jgi:hypothetical protein